MCLLSPLIVRAGMTRDEVGAVLTRVMNWPRERGQGFPNSLFDIKHLGVLIQGRSRDRNSGDSKAVWSLAAQSPSPKSPGPRIPGREEKHRGCGWASSPLCRQILDLHRGWAIHLL